MFILENLYRSQNIQAKRVIFMTMYAYTYMHVITINRKRGHEIERKKGGVNRRACGEEKGRENGVIILNSKIKGRKVNAN